MKNARQKRIEGHRLAERACVRVRHRWSFTVQVTGEARGEADQDGSPSGSLQGSWPGLRMAGGAGACPGHALSDTECPPRRQGGWSS